MKKHTLTIILFALVTNLSIHAQITISYSTGYGDYKMGDMKSLLEASLNSVQWELPGGTRITDNFPGYITHTLDFAYRLKRHEIGLKGTYMTTGGKIAYSDYSGKYSEKLTLNGYRLGAMYRFHFAKSQIGSLPLFFYGEVSPAITFTKLKYNAQLTLPDYDVHQTAFDNVSTNETGFSIQPLIGAQLFVTRNIFFTLSAGYDFEFGAKLSTANNIYRADWSGFRTSLGIGFMF